MKKPIFSHLLTETDKNYIRSKISRNPNDFELEFIAAVKQFDIRIRPYLQTIARMEQNQGIDKNIPAINKEVNSLYGISGTRIITSDNRLIGDDTVDNHIACNGGQLLTRYIDSFEKDQNTIKSIRRLPYNQTVKIKDKTSHTIVSSAVGINSQKDYSIPNSEVSIFVLKDDPDLNIHKILTDWIDRPWVYKLCPIDTGGLIQTIIEELRGTKFGVTITFDESDKEELLNKITYDYLNSTLVIIQKGFEKEVVKTLGGNNISFEQIGFLENSGGLTILQGKEKLISLPFYAFDCIWQNPQRGYTQNENDDIPDQIDLKSIKEKSTYNHELKALIKTIRDKDNQRIFEESSVLINKSNNHYGYDLKDSELSRKMFITSLEPDYFTGLDPRNGGKLSIANAVRQCVCAGAIPTSVIMHSVMPDTVKSNESWKGMEVIQGQEEAIRVFNLSVLDRRIYPYNDVLKQHTTVVGYFPEDIDRIQKGFVAEDDFITMIGSHRGELGGSAYFRNILNLHEGTPPMVDLGMESRLKEVLLQGIQGNLIRSASMGSEGGLAVSIAESLRVSKKGVGARIYLSRKLRNDELLFGETQGLIIISIEEKNIMEFERLCMSGGVPSTTIGRVTNDALFSFNDLINVNVNSLKKI